MDGLFYVCLLYDDWLLGSRWVAKIDSMAIQQLSLLA